MHLLRNWNSLLEVMTDEPLEVEVGQLIGRLESEQLLQLGIREDMAPVLRVLQVVLADVRVDLAGHLCAGNERTLRAAEELGELVTHKRGLDEAARSASSALVLALARRLLGRLEVALGLLLNALQLRNKDAHLLAHRVAQAGGGRFFQHLLVSALYRTVTLKQIHIVAMGVAKHLNLNMPGPLRVLFHQHVVVAKAAGGFTLA